MRIRTIKPSFYKHEDLYDLEIEEKLPMRLAFTGLWGASDREGRFKWKPRRLKADILPYDDIDFSRVLDALATRGIIVKYASNGDEFGYIPSFLNHQVINNRETPSILPNPDDSEVLTREARVDHASCARTSGREGKGREQEGKGILDKSNKAAKAAETKKYNSEFDTFWSYLAGYPHNKNHDAAQGRYASARRAGFEMDEIKRYYYEEHIQKASSPEYVLQFYKACTIGNLKSWKTTEPLEIIHESPSSRGKRDAWDILVDKAIEIDSKISEELN